MASAFQGHGDGAGDVGYVVPTTLAVDLQWNMDAVAADPGARRAARADGEEGGFRVPYEEIARALTDISGVTTSLQLAALPAGRKLSPYEPPRNAIERRLCTLYGQLLGIGRVGVKDHFFELGGHSLLATRLVALCQREFGIAMPLARIFETPVVEEFANVVQALQWAQVSADPVGEGLDEAIEEGAV
jgi:hypothetical protein